MASLEILDISNNPMLGRDVPVAWRSMGSASSTSRVVVNITGTKVRPDVFSPSAEREELCRKAVESDFTWSWQLVTTYFYFFRVEKGSRADQEYNVTLVSAAKNRTMSLFPGSPDTVCGDPLALQGIFIAWGIFLGLGGAAISLGWILGKQREHKDTIRCLHVEVSIIRNKWHHLYKAVKYHGMVLFYQCLNLYDLATDALMAFTIFPSWPFYVVLVFLAIPTFVISFVRGRFNFLHPLQPLCPNNFCGWWYERVYTWRGFPYIGLLVGLVKFIALPALSLILWILFDTLLLLTYALRPYINACSRDKVGNKLCKWLWGNMDPLKVEVLRSNVMAMTESLFVSIFVSIAYSLVARNPQALGGVFFSQLSFWLSLTSSMAHMVLGLFELGGTLRRHGRDLTWMREAFEDLEWKELVEPLADVQEGLSVNNADQPGGSGTAAAPLEMTRQGPISREWRHPDRC